MKQQTRRATRKHRRPAPGRARTCDPRFRKRNLSTKTLADSRIS